MKFYITKNFQIPKHVKSNEDLIESFLTTTAIFKSLPEFDTNSTLSDALILQVDTETGISPYNIKNIFLNTQHKQADKFIKLQRQPFSTSGNYYMAPNPNYCTEKTIQDFTKLAENSEWRKFHNSLGHLANDETDKIKKRNIINEAFNQCIENLQLLAKGMKIPPSVAHDIIFAAREKHLREIEPESSLAISLPKAIEAIIATEIPNADNDIHALRIASDDAARLDIILAFKDRYWGTEYHKNLEKLDKVLNRDNIVPRLNLRDVHQTIDAGKEVHRSRLHGVQRSPSASNSSLYHHKDSSSQSSTAATPAEPPLQTTPKTPGRT